MLANDVESSSELTTPESHLAPGPGAAFFDPAFYIENSTAGNTNGYIYIPNYGETILSFVDTSPVLPDGITTNTDLVPYIMSYSGTLGPESAGTYELSALMTTAGGSYEQSFTLIVKEYAAAVSVESLSEVSSPALTSSAAIDSLNATSVESDSSVTSPGIGQVHSMTATSVESDSNTASATINQVQNLAADNVQSTSSVTSPNFTGISQLLADNVEALTTVSEPAAENVFVLSADDVEALTEISSPAMTNLPPGVVAFLADDVDALSETSIPYITQVLVGYAETIVADVYITSKLEESVNITVGLELETYLTTTITEDITI